MNSPQIEPFVMINGARFIGHPVIEQAGLCFEYRTVRESEGLLLEAALTCAGDTPVHVERAGFVIRDDALTAPGPWRVFVDSGTLAWNGVRRLDDLDSATVARTDGPVHDAAAKCHRSSLQTVVWHPETQTGLLVGFCGQWHGQNLIDVWPDADGRTIRALEAWQEFALRPPGGSVAPSPLELEPNARLELDRLWISRGDAPLALLDAFGRRVQESLDRRPPTPTPITGYMTWYSKASAIDEETVIGNLPILQELFCGYPQAQRPMLILDHGWQQNASLGPLEADATRFPHGLAWLAQRVREHGFEPGIWHSLTNVTEDTPNHADIAHLLATDEQGAPLRGTLNLWDTSADGNPERAVNIPDAALQNTRQWWQDQLRALSRLGMRYFKLDFLALRTSSPNRPHAHAGRLHDHAWQTFRRAVTADTHLAPCSCDTNLALGRCDSVRISADIGEAGKWPGHARGYRHGLSAIAALWYKHRRFWTNDPDSLQLGKGCSMGEARVRATAAALSGGHLMLSEDLRGLAPARLELVRRLLPAVPTAAVPLDLFEAPFPEGYPAIWQWDVETPTGPARAVALFNLDRQTRTFTLNPSHFDLDASAEWMALEWWQQRWLGRIRGAADVEVPPQDVAIVHAQPATDTPAILSCSHHPAGLTLVESPRFDPDSATLSATLVTRPGLHTVVFGQMPTDWRLAGTMRSHAIANADGGWQCEVHTTGTRTPFHVEFGTAPSC